MSDGIGSRRNRQVGFVDTSIRDGNQSLWSLTGLTTPDVVAIAPTMERVGYQALDFNSSTHMAMAVRFNQEDPWERLRLMSDAMPNTKLSMIGTGMRFILWVPVGEDLMGLALRCAVRNGLRRFQIADPSNDPERIRKVAALSKKEGVEEVVVGMTYSISAVHTHQYYAEQLAALADCRDIDRFYLKDPGGILTVDAVRELAPAFLQAAGDRPIELHSHCTIGLAPFVYVEGARAGFHVVHTGCGPLSRGTAQPEVENTVSNLRAAGFEVDLDMDAEALVAEHFAAIAAERDKPAGVPQEFDGAYYVHQLPGGMVTTTQRMLAEIRRPELFDQVLEEVARVRAEMGYPIIVTPVSQFIATQATRNVIEGERWKTVTDETVRYFLGHYGDPPAPPDPEITEKVLSLPIAAKLRNAEPVTLEGAREKFGSRISDEELVLRLTMPAEQVDAMVANRANVADAVAAARPRRLSDPRPGGAPVVQLLKALADRQDIKDFQLTKGDEQVVWRRG